MEVSFYGTYDKDMFVSAMRLTERKTTWATVVRYLALGIALFGIGGTVYALITGELDQTNIARVIRNLVTASLLGYYFFSPVISQKRLLDKLFRGRHERIMQGNANQEGIAIGPNDGKTLFKWEQFVSKGEQGKLYALMTVDGSVAVFHKDFFATDSDWQRFKQMANQRVNEPK